MQFSAPSVYNVGRGVPVTVNELFVEFQANDPQDIQATYKPERYGEIGDFYSNIDCALSTGWEIQFDLKKGIKDTIDYFSKNIHV